MNKFLIFILFFESLFAQSSVTFNVTISSPIQGPPPIELFVIAGQSNATGASADWSSFQLPAIVSETGFRLSSVSNGTGGGNPTVFPSLSFQPAVNFTNQWLGPEIGFATNFENTFQDRELAIFKSAVGGTSLFTNWDHNPPTPLDLTRNTVNDLIAYRDSLEASTGRTVLLRGVFWWQGESDANNSNSFIWQGKMEETIQFWRDELGEPELNWYLGRLPDYQSAIYVNHAVIRTAVENMAAADPNVSVIDLDGLNSNDTVHIDQPSQLITGQRIFTAFAQDFPKLQAELEISENENGMRITRNNIGHLQFSTDLVDWFDAPNPTLNEWDYPRCFFKVR